MHPVIGGRERACSLVGVGDRGCDTIGLEHSQPAAACRLLRLGPRLENQGQWFIIMNPDAPILSIEERIGVVVLTYLDEHESLVLLHQEEPHVRILDVNCSYTCCSATGNISDDIDPVIRVRNMPDTIADLEIGN